MCLLLASCKRSPVSTTNETATNGVQSVNVLPASSRLLLGDTLRLDATATAQDGAPLSASVSWSTDAPSVVTVDGTGLVRSIHEGDATVLATVDGVVGQAEVTVPAPSGVATSHGGDVVNGVAPGGSVELRVPAGALPGPVPITIEPLSASFIDSVAPDPRLVPGTPHRFAPNGLHFAEPATLSIRYDPSVLTDATPSNLLRVHELVDGGWKLVPESRVDTVSHTVSGAIEGFSMYGVVAVENHPPTATIESPAPGVTVLSGDAVTLVGSGTDPEDGALHGSKLVWRSNLDGFLGTGDSVRTTGLSVGTHVITLVATDLNGAADTASTTLTVKQRVNEPPSVIISSPQPGATFTQGHAVTLIGSATDPEDGVLTGSSLSWRSSLDGVLGTGRTLTTSSLSVGSHDITLTAVDSQGARDSATVTITVVAPPPGVQPGSVEGRVVREQDGRGVGGVEVLLVSASADTMRVRTDNAGVYTFAHVDPGGGPYTVALVTGTLPPFGTLKSSPSQVITVASGQHVDVAAFRFQVPEMSVRTVVSPDAGAVGDTVTVTLEIGTSAIPQPIAAATVGVDWDATAAAFVVTNPGASSLNLCATNKNAVGSGNLSASCISVSGTGADPLVALQFRVAARSAGSVAFTPHVIELDAIDQGTGVETDLTPFVIFNVTQGTWTIH